MPALIIAQGGRGENLLEGNEMNTAQGKEALRQGYGQKGHGRKIAEFKAAETPERAAPGRQGEVC